MIVFTWPIWATIAVVLVGIAVFFIRSRVLGLVIIAVAVFNGVTSTNWPLDRMQTGWWFILAVAIALGALYVALRWDNNNLVRYIGTLAASAALILALFNSFWALYGMARDAINDPMKAYIGQQVDATNKRVDAEFKLQSSKDNEQDSRIKSLEGRMDNVEKRLDSLENRVSQNEAVLNGVVSVKLASDTNLQALIDKMAADLKNAGWKPGDFTVGTVTWNGHVDDRGSAAFSQHTLKTQDQVKQYINGTGANQVAAREYLLSNTPASEKNRLLSGIGFIPVQFTQGICLDGNTYFDGKHAVTMKDVRCHDPGYVLWVYAGADGTVYWGAALASDCGNPGMTTVVHPKDKPAKPATQLCKEGDYKGQTPVDGSCWKPQPGGTVTTTVVSGTTTARATATMTTTVPVTTTATATTTATTTVPVTVPPKTSAPAAKPSSSPASGDSIPATADPLPSPKATPLAPGS